MAHVGVRTSIVAVTTAGALLAGAVAPATAAWDGPEGCPAAYWLSHQDNWQEYQPSFRVSNAWHMSNLPLAERRLTFAQALVDPGGTATASRVLLRSAVTAYLNAAHEGVMYPYRRFDRPYRLHETVEEAIADGDRREMREITRDLDRANDRHCPLH